MEHKEEKEGQNTEDEELIHNLNIMLLFLERGIKAIYEEKEKDRAEFICPRCQATAVVSKIHTAYTESSHTNLWLQCYSCDCRLIS